MSDLSVSAALITYAVMIYLAEHKLPKPLVPAVYLFGYITCFWIIKG